MPETFDLCVIGGGIHGAGVAQAAALSGLSVALVEKSGWGAGTSSKSSKLVHGGLRYLQTFQFSLVRQSLRERRTLLTIADDIVKPNHFYLPIYKGGRFKPWQVRIGLILYRLLAGRNNLGGFKKLPKSEWDQLQGLNSANLEAVFIYQDAQTDDKTLTQRVVASAEQHGATLFCPARFLTAEQQEDGYLITIAQQLEHGSELTTIACRTLVNAGGPWINRIADTIEPKPPIVNIDLVKGTHLQFAQQLSAKCFYLEAHSDHRAVFVLPYKDGTLVGTTEKLFEGNPDGVSPSHEEVDYLLEIMHHQFPHFNHNPINTWAGLRVLPAIKKSPFKRSREVQFAESPNYIAIYGGKLTGYRATAEIVLRKIRSSMQQRAAQSSPGEPTAALFKIVDSSKVKI